MKFKPLEDITDRAQLFTEENKRLLAALYGTDTPRFSTLMDAYRARHVRGVAEIETEAKRTCKALKKKTQIKKATADGFQRDENDAIKTNQHNLLLAFDRLGVRLKYDAFAASPIIEGIEGRGPALDDPALNKMFFIIDQTFSFKPAEPYFTKFVMHCCYENSFHPVRDYLDGLAWDGVHRLDNWLTTYAGVDETPLSRACGKNVLIAAVRRVRKPGTKFDEMLVLEGAEGLSKSTLLRLLAVNDDWFTDSLPLSADDKMMIETSGGKWIVEVAELQGISKSDHTRIKAQLSRQTDRARLAYGRLPTEVKRQFVVIGTTNGERYLASLTGNRRFMPFRVHRVDLAAFEADRDRLWAEASNREAAGESTILPEALWIAARREQEARELDNMFLDELAHAVGDQPGILFMKDAWVICGKSNPQAGDFEKLRKAMAKLGFTERRRYVQGARVQAFVRGKGKTLLNLGLIGKGSFPEENGTEV